MKKISATLVSLYFCTLASTASAIEMIHEMPLAIEMPPSIKLAFRLDSHKTIIIAFVAIICLALLGISRKKQ